MEGKEANLPCNRAKGQCRLVWIDLHAATASALDSAQRADGRMLAASMLGVAPDRALPTPVVAALTAVPGDGDAAYAVLAATVWAAFATT